MFGGGRQFEIDDDEASADMPMADDDAEPDGPEPLDGSMREHGVIRNGLVYSKLPAFLLDLRELGEEATWTLSSAKSGNGAEALRNGETQTYWQSDGTTPHMVTVQFHRRVALSYLAMYSAYNLDESYTPKHIRIFAGSHIRDMEFVTEVHLASPDGWVLIDLRNKETEGPLRCFILEIKCVAMHHNGRDTHIRAIKLFGPKASSNLAGSTEPGVAGMSRTSAALAARMDLVTSLSDDPMFRALSNLR